MMIFLRWRGDSARASGHGAVLAILVMNLRNGVDRRPNLFIERGMTAFCCGFGCVFAGFGAVGSCEGFGWVGVVGEVGGGAGVADGDFE